MIKFGTTLFTLVFWMAISLQSQTVIPNAGFEAWTDFGSYSDPTGWDTPNEELMIIPFIGITVVSKSTDHHGTGSFSAKLETKHYTFPPTDVPGFLTCGNLTIDLASGSYLLSGGAPVVDFPTHLKGFYKYFPKGGDSCVIGIGLTKTTGAIVDTIGMGSFSTKDTVTDWTPFSAWIDYISTLAPDTMNIIALSTAQELMTIGTVLYIDDLFLDYTVGYGKHDPASGISVYNDKETKRLMLFFNFEQPEFTFIRLFNMTGRTIHESQPKTIRNERSEISYPGIPGGVYLLQVVHDNKVYSKKIYLD